MTEGFKNTLAWLLVGTVGVFVAMNWASASFTGTEYLPAGNDSFYHARRILDAVQDPAAFFEYDPKIHVPEGSWITWPWLYDYLVAGVVRMVASLSGIEDPMAILVYIPVLWAYVTVGLMFAISAALGLPLPLRILTALFAAVLPLNQALHGVGRIDHHYMEYTFVLLAILGGIRWLRRSDDIAAATFLGFSLGLSVGFHNGLFVLQLPILAALFICWWRKIPIDAAATRWFSLGMLVSILLVLLPSQPFRMGWFEFYFLSWFHLYVTAGTAFCAMFIGHVRFRPVNLLLLSVAGVAMLVPLVTQFILAGDFLTRRLARLEGIEEAKSILTMLRGPGGRTFIESMYSLLLWSLPIVLVGSAIRLFLSRSPERIYFHVWVLAGILMMLQQFRLYYFGSFALILPAMLAVHWAGSRWPGRRALLYVATAALLAASLYPDSFYRMTRGPQIAIDSRYRHSHYLLQDLRDLCRKNPGVALSYNDAGHYIRYFTDCSVVANNFLLIPIHEQKIAELDQLLSMTPEELLRNRPDVKYLLIDFPKTYLIKPDGGMTLLSADELRRANASWPLINQLLLAESVEDIDPRFRVVRQSNIQEGDREITAARLIEILPAGEEGKPAAPGS